ncbi:hypothetical protein, partial [Lacimonas salitolerans]
RIKVTSHLATLNHFEADMGILKRQQTLARRLPISMNVMMNDMFPWRLCLSVLTRKSQSGC